MKQQFSLSNQSKLRRTKDLNYCDAIVKNVCHLNYGNLFIFLYSTIDFKGLFLINKHKREVKKLVILFTTLYIISCLSIPTMTTVELLLLDFFEILKG